MLIARFWHPSLRRWSETPFESLEHAMHLFVDESGWVLRQQQALDGPHAFELIFEARREDFSRPSTEAMLQDVGLLRGGRGRPDRAHRARERPRRPALTLWWEPSDAGSHWRRTLFWSPW